ncbi:Sit4-associated protein [Lasiodiplodia theobromae]|uniref:Extragenic suppressor of kinetochore protein 1 n=1 Tax=Lasiodiplodia theobromae TaxID=45133 RepID=A0A5N5DV35_9PEZI|nr:Sit4-associated protein [Lasiodiplodia theobromae]KAB2580822.1 Extragenic suppressor of kinetochore protein 1 [Lasiodiplodia theobromae]KAF4542505.1 Sit4-associated protein [Lasiodiplodia theobromae]
MFWRFGGYANISTLDSILDKPDVTIEELLDESDLIQELKQQNSKLIQYLRDDKILERLLQFVIAPSSPAPQQSPGTDNAAEGEGDEKGGAEIGSFFKRRSRSISIKSDSGENEEGKEEKQRMKYAYVACEILSSEVWSISEALLENQAALRKFWDYLKQPAPLDPVQAGYFTKVNESLLDRKTEEMLEFFKSIDGIVSDMLQHVDCPMVMDLLLKIISLEKAEGGQGIVDWLQQHNLIPTLLSFLSPDYNASAQTSAGDFLKAIITISANATTQDQTVIGPNELTRQLVSEPCIKSLITEMLRGGNPLTVGVGIVIEVIRKNNSDYDMENQTGPVPRSSDPIYLGTLLRQFATHVPDFMALVHNATEKVVNEDGTTTTKQRELKAAFGGKIEPLGFDRFKTCELMAELLHCSNMALLNERGSEAAVKARDAERERLKAAGKLTSAKESEEHSILDNEFGTSVDSHGFHHARAPSSESPEEVKKLEVQNNVKDEDFEEVAACEAEPEEAKDGEKAEIGEPLERSPKLPPRTVETEKEPELVDEPLSDKPANEKADSPTAAGLTDKVGDLDLEKQDATMTDSSSTEKADGEADATKPTVSLLTQQLNQTSDADEAAEDISPRPEDKPAPLFSKKPENGDATKNAEENRSTTPADDELLSEQQVDFSTSQRAQYEVDIDGNPVVGDLLKIMFVEHRVVPTILDFFFRFPWNNFLHNVVYDVVQQVFNGQMERGYNRALAIDLFETGRITERIIEGQQASDKAQAETSMRLGYMGHLTLIAEEVVKFTERHPPELLSLSVLEKVINQQWTDYVEHTLAETRERDNAILGGVRPDMAVGPRQAVLNAVNAASGFGNSSLASAGLGGNGSVGLDSMELTGSGGGYGLSGGSLLSGFNNSSDEEDEDMEEGEGERQTTPHVSDSDQPLQSDDANDNTAAGSPDAGSNPVPAPAPLQIPPSRARRQFAARLAERKRQQEQEQQQQQQGTVAAAAAASSSSAAATAATAATGTGAGGGRAGDWTERYNDPGRFSNLFVGGGVSDEESTDDDDDGEELIMKDSFSRRSVGSGGGGSASGSSANGSVSGDEGDDAATGVVRTEKI